MLKDRAAHSLSMVERDFDGHESNYKTLSDIFFLRGQPRLTGYTQLLTPRDFHSIPKNCPRSVIKGPTVAKKNNKKTLYLILSGLFCYVFTTMLLLFTYY